MERRGALHRHLGGLMSHTIRITIAAAAGLLVAACGTQAGQRGTSPSATALTPVTTSSPATPAPSPSPVPLGYQPLYPFASLADVQAWQDGYTAGGGGQSWHLSPDGTALSFTQAYLGFKEINRVASHTVGDRDARVTVGLLLPNGTISHAAVVHLVKYGSGRYVPWEVVGTDDTAFTLDTPAYGATVTSPVKVGGDITGVDESIGVEVHQLGSPAAVGSHCCEPAGGQDNPWSVTVAFRAASGQVITIVAHTGGHVAAVERFAVTGVTVG